MKCFKINFSKNGIIALILAMLFVFPNLDVYSSLGSYTIESQGLRANSLSEFSNDPPKIRKNWAAIGWLVAGVAVCTGVDHYFGDNLESAWNQFDNSVNYVNDFGDPVIADYQIKQNYNMVCNGFCQSFPKTYKSNYHAQDFSRFDN